jgi:hypothetical protein
MQSSATDLLRLSMVDAATSRVKMTAIPRLSTSHLHSARSRWHYLAVSFFIMQSTGFFGVIDRIKYGEWSEKTGDLFTQSLNALQILVSIFLFWVGYNNAKRLSLGAALLLIVVAYLFMSVLWSVDPQTSFRRSIIYFFFALGVIGIANSLSGDEYLELLRKLVFLSAIASLVLLVTLCPMGCCAASSLTRTLWRKSWPPGCLRVCTG